MNNQDVQQLLVLIAAKPGISFDLTLKQNTDKGNLRALRL
jgi:hypothetical protein